MADDLELVHLITTQSRLEKMGFLRKLLQRQATLYTQVFQSFLYG